MSSAPEDCIFCKIVRGELPAVKVHEDELTLSFMDISPATRGHVLVIPKAHAEDLMSVPAEDLQAVIREAQRLAERLRSRLAAQGVNLLNSNGAAAWQTVFHFHVHVIPRYEGDPLKLPWVPTAGDPEEIAALGAQLCA